MCIAVLVFSFRHPSALVAADHSTVGDRVPTTGIVVWSAVARPRFAYHLLHRQTEQWGRKSYCNATLDGGPDDRCTVAYAARIIAHAVAHAYACGNVPGPYGRMQIDTRRKWHLR